MKTARVTRLCPIAGQEILFRLPAHLPGYACAHHTVYGMSVSRVHSCVIVFGQGAMLTGITHMSSK